MSTPELKPCPFCGSAPHIERALTWCSDPGCKASRPVFTHAEWNTRHNPAESEELQRHREGEEWCASMFAKIMAVGISGLADAAVIGRGPFTAEHALRTVEMLRDRARKLESALNAAREALKEANSLGAIMAIRPLTGQEWQDHQQATSAAIAQIDPQQSKTT